jgi:hypothetical protein
MRRGDLAASLKGCKKEDTLLSLPLPNSHPFLHPCVVATFWQATILSAGSNQSACGVEFPQDCVRVTISPPKQQHVKTPRRKLAERIGSGDWRMAKERDQLAKNTRDGTDNFL